MWLTDPAALLAVHVKFPSWRYPTPSMLRKLAEPPSCVVDMAGSEVTSLPAKLQVMLTGGSPRRMEQMTCARSPSSRIVLPKVKGSD